MSTIFAGSSISDFDAGGVATVTTSATYIDTTVVSEGIYFGTNNGGFVKKTFESTYTEVWIGWRMAVIASNANASAAVITIYSDEKPLFHLRGQNVGAGSTWATFNGDIMYWNSSGVLTTFTGGADFWGLVDSSIFKFDIHLKIHSSTGYLRLYQNGALIFDSGSMNTAQYGTSLNAIVFGSAGMAAGHSFALSEVFVGDSNSDSRSVRVCELALSANGANTAWTNGKTEVDETGYDDSDFIYSASANDKETYTLADLPSTGAVANWQPNAVVVSARGRRADTGPQNLQGVVRVNSTDYASASISLVEGSFKGGLQAVWEVSPDTSTYWTRSEVNALEAGVKSIT